jgi:DNA helicase IV
MEGWDEIDRLLIKGCAGSGKTLIASEAARRLAARGKKVLMLCFTEGLARWLKAQHTDTGVRVEPIRIFAKSILRNNSQSLSEVGDDNLDWDKLAFEAAGVVEEKKDPELFFDAVIVDEAQDLEIGDWELIRCLSGDNKLWAFHDPKQQFWQDREPDQSLFNTKINLKNNYRTPHSLMEVANSYGMNCDSTALVQTALDEKTLDVICAPSPSSIAKKVELEIKKLRGDRFDAHRIAVLSLRGKSATDSILKKLNLPDIDCYSVDEELADDHLIADTFLRFKGLERDAVIITDLCPDQSNYATRMHIALTRSLACARVITTREILGSDPVLSCILDKEVAGND